MVERLYADHRGLNGLVAPAQDPATSMDLAQCFLVLALGAQIVGWLTPHGQYLANANLA